MGESGRVGQGQACALDYSCRTGKRSAGGWEGAARFNIGEHRHCLRHAGRGDRHTDRAGGAGERLGRAQANSRRLRGEDRGKRSLRRFGWCDPARAGDGSADPDRYYFADQYSNPANPAAHVATTGPEIWSQTDNRVTHFVAGLGTTGTLMGTGRYLKQQNQFVELVGVQPADSFHGLEGLKHLPTAIVPAIYDASLPDRLVEVDTGEAYAAARGAGERRRSLRRRVDRRSACGRASDWGGSDCRRTTGGDRGDRARQREQIPINRILGQRIAG